MNAAARPVVGFGALSEDDLIYVDGPLQAGKGKVLRREHAFGGNVATALAAVARLGGRASFVGWLNDRADDPSVAALLGNGVSIENAYRASECRPIAATIVVGADGDRFIAYDDEVKLGASPGLSDAVLQGAGALVIDGYAVRTPDTVFRARALGVPVVADVEWTIGEPTERIVAAADHLVLPLGFARRLAGCRNPADVLRALWRDDRAAVVLTDGANGVHVLARNVDAVHVPSFSVPVVDTTGAGDCFHGAYAYALAAGYSVGECVRLASAAAALSVGGRGGQEALPTLAEVEALLARAPTPARQSNASPGDHEVFYKK